MNHTRLLSSSERAATRSMESGRLFRNEKPSRESVLVAKVVSVNLDRKPFKPNEAIPYLGNHILAINALLESLTNISNILIAQVNEAKNE